MDAQLQRRWTKSVEELRLVEREEGLEAIRRRTAEVMAKKQAEKEAAEAASDRIAAE